MLSSIRLGNSQSNLRAVALYLLHIILVILFSVFMLLFVDKKAVAVDGAQSSGQLPKGIGLL
jgi:hypothetical protein